MIPGIIQTKKSWYFWKKKGGKKGGYLLTPLDSGDFGPYRLDGSH